MLGAFLVTVFVGLTTLVPLLMGRIPSDLDEMTLLEACRSPAVLLPALSSAVLAGGFVRSRWLLPSTVLLLGALLVDWHRQFGSATTEAVSLALTASAVIIAWAGWSSQPAPPDGEERGLRRSP